ncbi:peptidase M48, Ste24p [gamma proteobacterium HTCC5015]|nr:peptidase M48, Ste24p [gamma proteobacterium HTCC5015]
MGARAVIYALLTDDDNETRQHQRQHVNNLDGLVGKYLDDLLHTPLKKEEHRLTLLDMSLPQLAEMAPDVRDAFEACLDALIKADRKVNLFEWSMERIIHHYLLHQFDTPKPAKPKYRQLKPVAPAVQLLLSVIALAGTQSEQRETAFREGMERAGLKQPMLPTNKLSLDALNQALDQLKRLYPLAKPSLLKACIATITSDGEISPRERELIRAIADSLDCPMPPLQV